jgi:hypothetical protein
VEPIVSDSELVGVVVICTFVVVAFGALVVLIGISLVVERAGDPWWVVGAAFVDCVVMGFDIVVCLTESAFVPGSFPVVFAVLMVEMDVVVNRSAPANADTGPIGIPLHCVGRVSLIRASMKPGGHSPASSASVYKVPK